MNTALIIILILSIITVIVTWLISRPKKPMPLLRLPENLQQLLLQHVPFYTQLDDVKKGLFESRVQHFLATVTITGVKTGVNDLDRVLVAASAVIPIFAFPDWEYINLHEVLLYPDSFNDSFKQEGAGRDTLGMVGSGAWQHIMILSKHELRQGFMNNTGKSNTAIHEFVHLLDKTDGDIDGIPEIIMANSSILPWLEMVRKAIREIKDNESDIDPYAATNQAEFFAVVSEYFFERPDLLQEKHPGLFALLVKIFRQEPTIPGKYIS